MRGFSRLFAAAALLASVFGAVTAITVATANATVLTYSLNGSYAEDGNRGPSLVPMGVRSGLRVQLRA